MNGCPLARPGGERGTFHRSARSSPARASGHGRSAQVQTRLSSQGQSIASWTSSIATADGTLQNRGNLTNFKVKFCNFYLENCFKTH